MITSEEGNSHKSYHNLPFIMFIVEEANAELMKSQLKIYIFICVCVFIINIIVLPFGFHFT